MSRYNLQFCVSLQNFYEQTRGWSKIWPTFHTFLLPPSSGRSLLKITVFGDLVPCSMNLRDVSEALTASIIRAIAFWNVGQILRHCTAQYPRRQSYSRWLTWRWRTCETSAKFCDTTRIQPRRHLHTTKSHRPTALFDDSGRMSGQ
jgi:hypothetical protein